MPDILEIELDPAAVADPYAAYARMRAADGLSRHATEGYYFVSRYEDVREAAMRPDDFSSAIMSALVRSNRLLAGLPSGVFDALEMLAVADDPAHAAHRKLMKRHFTANPVAEITRRARPRIERKVERFVTSGGGDFAADIAAVVPIEMTLELLGFPPSDGPRLKRIVDGCVELLAGQLPRDRKLASFIAGAQLFRYTRSRVREMKGRSHEAAPICRALLEAAQDGTLPEILVPGIVSQLIAAGIDSTASLLGNALRMLAESPELAQQLREDPSLVPSFIEECLRLEAPFQGHFRVVRRPTQLAGTELVPGDRLMLLWAAANRDPEVFPAPDELLLDRARTMGGHVSFGHGYHLCLGAALARATARTVVTGLLERTQSVSLTESPPVLRPSPYLRTLTSLPLCVAAAPQTWRNGSSTGEACNPSRPEDHAQQNH